MHVYKNIKFESFQGFTKLSDYIFMSTHLNDDKTYFPPAELLYKIAKLFTFFLTKKIDFNAKITDDYHLYIFCQPTSKKPTIGLAFNTDKECYIISESSFVINSSTVKELKESINLNIDELFSRFDSSLDLTLKLFAKCHEKCSVEEKNSEDKKLNNSFESCENDKKENKFDKSNYIQL